MFFIVHHYLFSMKDMVATLLRDRCKANGNNTASLTLMSGVVAARESLSQGNPEGGDVGMKHG
jgi:hypothetical protein